jgi:hypothetical protein
MYKKRWPRIEPKPTITTATIQHVLESTITATARGLHVLPTATGRSGREN